MRDHVKVGRAPFAGSLSTGRGRIFPFVDVTNNDSTRIRLARTGVTYPGSSVAAPAPIVQNLDIDAGTTGHALIGAPDGEPLVSLRTPPSIALADWVLGHPSEALGCRRTLRFALGPREHGDPR